MRRRVHAVDLQPGWVIRLPGETGHHEVLRVVPGGRDRDGVMVRTTRTARIFRTDRWITVIDRGLPLGAAS